MSKTAVEWLVEQMISQMGMRIENTTIGEELFEQAKAMELEHIEHAWHDGRSPYGNMFLGDYLDKTYGKEASHEG